MLGSPKRLIEVAFPLKQTSLDSVHEKNVRHGHISTLHIWPARRPLAACRAALIATLLPDPGDPVERKMILEKLGGKIVQKVKRKRTEAGWVEEVSEETEGGILHWGRESGPDLDWFRAKIREAYGGRAPKVLDPFAGGGAIPLEAMRLGCETTAVDINPVAWFILKCTLEYPQKLAGQTRPLPDFALQDREFMQDYLKSKGFSRAALEAQLDSIGVGVSGGPKQNELPGLSGAESGPLIADSFREADLAWHVRAWGRWVLKEARKELAPYYPTYADFEPLVEVTGKVETRPMQLVPLKADGTSDNDALNAEFSPQYLAEKRNPRWVAKPTVAYLWARTVTCKNCRATIPLLKTRWLCKKANKRVLMTMVPNPEKNGVVFGIWNDVPVFGKSIAEKKVYELKVGGGTTSRSGVTCPCCEVIMTTEYLRLEGKAGRMGSQMTVVAVEGPNGKDYRLPTQLDILHDDFSRKNLAEVFEKVPFGLPSEPITEDAKGNTWCVQYGIDQFDKLFNIRQLISLGTLVRVIRESRNTIFSEGYNSTWTEAINVYIVAGFTRLLDFVNVGAQWKIDVPTINHYFVRYALTVSWDYAESNIVGDSAGSYELCFQRICIALDSFSRWNIDAPLPKVYNNSVLKNSFSDLDLILTDPPYYDSVGYSVIMDFFYVWLRRLLAGLNDEIDSNIKGLVAPKWDHDENDGELVDDANRFGGNSEKSKKIYEDGMAEAFGICHKSLTSDGRLVIVFAHKHPDAWETLVSAIIKAGFVVSGSWPIQTEQPSRMRALVGSALASSIWLICKKRNSTARPGWDNKVMDEMRKNITTQLRDFWDAGIRGPDFVWAATGPAMEAYSQYPVVKKANEPGAVMTVTEFLTQVRRMVVDFVVGRVLSADGGDAQAVSGLDNVTTYYLLHRNDFKLDDAPAGPCILYAVSCGLSDKDLADRYDLLARRGGKEQEEPEEGEEGEAEQEGSGSSFRLKAWNQRKNPHMGYDLATDSSPVRLPLFPDMEREVQATREIPLIDQVHRLMHLWKSGDVSKVNEYLDLRGLRRNPLFHQLLQALIELAPAGNEERSLIESISNHVGGKISAAQRLF